MSPIRPTTRTAGPVSAALAITFAVLYAVLSPDVTRQPWDSLSYAYAAETPHVATIFANHPLGHALQNVTLWVAQRCGYAHRALPLFVVVGSIFGGLTVGCFYLLCERLLEIGRRVSLALAVMLGGSYALWHHAGTADIYSFSLLLCAIAWAGLVYVARFRARLGFAGALVGLATLGHQLNGVLALSGAFIVLSTGHRDTTGQRLFRLLGAAALVVVLGNVLVGYAVTASTSPVVLAEWAKGYLGHPGYGRSLHLEGFRVAAGTAAGAVMHDPTGRVASMIRDALLIIMIVLTLRGIVLRRRLDRPLQVIVGAALLQCVVGWGLIWWWEPFNDKFWVLLLVPWFLLLAGSSLVSVAFCHRYLPLLALGVVLGNLLSGILVGATPRAEMRDALDAWTRNSQPPDLLIPTEELLPYLRYWEHRPEVLLLHRTLQEAPPDDRFRLLRAAIAAAIERGAQVLYCPTAVENTHGYQLDLAQVRRDALRDELARHDWQEAFSYVDVNNGRQLHVYRLRAPAAATP